MARGKDTDRVYRYKEVRIKLKQVLEGIRGTVEEIFSRHVEEDPFQGLYTQEQLLEPPYSFDRLYTIYEESDILQSCVEAMQLNITGFGYELAFLGDDVKERESPEARVQRTRMENFFDYANGEQSWMSLRKLEREDREVLGNSALEIVRNRRGEAQMVFQIPFKRLRIAALEGRAVTVEQPLMRDGKEVRVKVKKYFRRFAQVSSTGKKVRWFKSFGDPRTLDAVSGVFKSPAQCKIIASEILHFKHPFGGLTYGMPRWIGAVLDVMGRRNAQFVNYDLFNSQGIPPMAILVSGGVLTDESIEELEAMIRSMRGVEKWNRIMLLESNIESVGLEEKGSARIELKNLAEYRKEDQMFENYLGQTGDTARHRFRLPPLYIGSSESFTHACYDAVTETLTENGWKNFWNVLPGEKIATLNPKNGRLEYHVPEELHVYPSPARMVEVETRGASLCVTPNHDLWLQKYIRAMPAWEKIKAEDVVASPTNCYRMKVAPDAVELGMLPDDLPVDDTELFLEAIGSIVADGSIDRERYRVRFNVKKERKKARYWSEAEALAGCLDDAELVTRPGTREGYLDIEIRSRTLHAWCESNLLTDVREKKLPDWSTMLDTSLASGLLDALIFGDGCDVGRGPNSRCYVTTSQVLADQVQILAFRLGWRARITTADGSDRGRKLTYYVHMTKTSTQMIQKKHVVEKEHPYKDLVYCFHVENHLFVVRRAGCISIHGNTARAAQNVAEEQVFVPERGDDDEVINSRIVRPELQVDLWKYKSKGPQVVGSDEIAKGIDVFSQAGALTVNHAIALANRAFGTDMSKFEEPWANYPIMLVLKMIEAGAQLKEVPFATTPALPSVVPVKQPALPGLPAKVFKSDMFSEEERQLYKRLIFLQDAIDRGLSQEEITEEKLEEAI